METTIFLSFVYILSLLILSAVLLFTLLLIIRLITHQIARTFYLLKYEVSVKAKGLLWKLFSCKIPFTIEILENEKSGNISIHEYSGDCNPAPMNGWIVTQKTEFYAIASGRNPEKVTVVLRCEYDIDVNSKPHYFKLKFDEKKIHRAYSRTLYC
jgi:hypothetical protein